MKNFINWLLPFIYGALLSAGLVGIIRITINWGSDWLFILFFFIFLAGLTALINDLINNAKEELQNQIDELKEEIENK